jgi:hypothetical protein
MISQVERYGMTVWENHHADKLRKTECLCLSCDKLDTTGKNNCPVATKFFEICKEYGNALLITRCKEWKEKVEF